MTSGLQAADRVISLVRENAGLANHGDGCSAEVIGRAEADIGLAFPPSYRRLIEVFGTWEVPPAEFPGVYQSPSGSDELLGSSAYTLEDRVELGLPHQFLVVKHDDVLGVVVLDTSQPDDEGEYPVFAWNPGVTEGGLMEKVADNFGAFALSECRQNMS